MLHDSARQFFPVYVRHNPIRRLCLFSIYCSYFNWLSLNADAGSLVWILLTFSHITAFTGGLNVKIADILSQQLNQYDTTKNTAKRNSSDFADLLRDVENRTSTGSTTNVSAVQELLSTSSVGNIMAAGKMDLGAELDQTLDLLEGYSQALADPDRPLEDLEPMIQDLENQAERLSSTAAKGSGDPALRDLADQASILAMVEAAKFKRGDYT